MSLSVAKAYARAFYETAYEKDPNLIDQIEDQLNSVTKIFNSSSDVRTALLGPIVTAKEKISVIEQIAKRTGFSDSLVQFLSLLARKGRLNLIQEIYDAYVDVRLQAEGGLVGQLVAADPVNEKDVKGLAEAFSRKLGKKVAFQVSTDESLLAGMKVTVNGVTYDGTLRSQLQKLRDRLMVGLT